MATPQKTLPKRRDPRFAEIQQKQLDEQFFDSADYEVRKQREKDNAARLEALKKDAIGRPHLATTPTSGKGSP